MRAVAAALTAVAKERNMACVLVGHVTKDGAIAGSAGAGAPGRRGAAVRGRPALDAATGARGEEPVRPGRRGRLLPDGRRTASSGWPIRRACSCPAGAPPVPGTCATDHPAGPSSRAGRAAGPGHASRGESKPAHRVRPRLGPRRDGDRRRCSAGAASGWPAGTCSPPPWAASGSSSRPPIWRWPLAIWSSVRDMPLPAGLVVDRRTRACPATCARSAALERRLAEAAAAGLRPRRSSRPAAGVDAHRGPAGGRGGRPG